MSSQGLTWMTLPRGAGTAVLGATGSRGLSPLAGEALGTAPARVPAGGGEERSGEGEAWAASLALRRRSALALRGSSAGEAEGNLAAPAFRPKNSFRSGTGTPRRDMRETKRKNEFTGKLQYLVSAEGNAKSRTRQRAQARPALSLERSSSAAACAAQSDINATHVIIIMLLCLARRHSWATLRGRRENSGANQNRNAQSESVGFWAERP